MNTITREGVIYARVSSNKQVSDGNGLDSQHRTCLRFAADNNIKVIETIIDPGYSGKSSHRPGIYQLYKFLESRTEDIFVIADAVDRYSRSTKYYQYFKDDLAAKGGILRSPGHDYANKDPANIFSEHIKIGMAEFERLTNNNRVNSRMRERVRAGFWVFRPPVGMLFKDKFLIPDGINSPLIRKIYEDFANGKYSSYETVKKSKESRLLINLDTNKPYQLGSSFIKRMLTNKLYTGVVEYSPWDIKEVDSLNNGFIDRELYENVQARIKKKPKRVYSVVNQDDFPLKGNLECGSCSQILRFNYSKGRSQKYPYYRCDNTNECDLSPKSISRDIIHNDFINLLKKASIRKEVLTLADKIMEDTFNKNSTHLKGIKHHNDIKTKELISLKNNQLEKVIRASNPSIISALEKEINSIDSQITALREYEVPEDDLKQFRLQGLDILKKPHIVWQSSNLNKKRMIFDLIFENNLKVIDGRIGTAQYTLLYRLMSNKRMSKNRLVELGGIEPPTSCVPRKRSPS
jgi:site-specific DNA recombinase